MTRSIRILRAVVIATLTLASAACADDQDAIEYRQHIMTALNEQAAMLGLIVSTAVPDDNAVAHLDALALIASTALKSFEPKVPGGEAKAEVWADWADFSQRMNEFAEKTRQAAKVAKERGKEEALGSILNVLTCKSCHDVYRKEKKK